MAALVAALPRIIIDLLIFTLIHGHDDQCGHSSEWGHVLGMTALPCCQIYSPKRGNANNNYFDSIFFRRSMREMLRRDRDLHTINAVKRYFGER